MHPITLICLVGLPRSGKTTWARRQGLPIVNPDSIRLALHGQRFRQEAEPFVWAIAKCMVRALFLAGHEMVILDATNTTRDRRDFWQDEDWKTSFRLMDAGRDVCIGRADLAGDKAIRPIIESMARDFQGLGSDELVNFRD